MSRIYTDFAQGILSANPASGATSLSSAEFSSLPTITAPDYLHITLDPNGPAPEKVTITAHAGGATSVTCEPTTGTYAAAPAWAAGVYASDLAGLQLSFLRDDVVEALVAASNPVGVRDFTLARGDYIAFGHYGWHDAASWKAGPSTYTVPAGKKLVVVAFESSVFISWDSASRRVRLWNVGTGAEVAEYQHFQFRGAPWAGDGAELLMEFAAGTQLRIDLWNGDTSRRAIGGHIIGKLVSV
jgi:hypothetical protein